LGASWMPAPTPPTSGASPSTTARKPLRASPSAAARPPIPPPATITGFALRGALIGTKYKVAASNERETAFAPDPDFYCRCRRGPAAPGSRPAPGSRAQHDGDQGSTAVSGAAQSHAPTGRPRAAGGGRALHGEDERFGLRGPPLATR